ncbi:MAG TPA: outer membrane beta-barrel protein [Xanthobacteraceae bacterium]|nr:outer membrane beta-barrel protein [Xanthobacteraceae bacterium]
MRRVIYALLAFAFAPSAFADDLSWLTGAQPAAPMNVNGWAGIYIGGQVSYSNAGGDFSKTTQAPLAFALRELTLENEQQPSSWPVLGQANHSAAGFGGFAGYNTQFERLILGVEANYDQANLSLTAPNSPISRRVTAGGIPYDVTVTGSGSVSELNFGTLRARGGWALGNFLPYAFAGVAVGHANVNIVGTTFGVQNPPLGCPAGTNPPCVPFSFTGTAGKNGEWMVGFTFGGGLDVALTRNVFLRAEYEYVQFAPIANLVVDVNTVRGGLGIKF